MAKAVKELIFLIAKLCSRNVFEKITHFSSLPFNGILIF